MGALTPVGPAAELLVDLPLVDGHCHLLRSAPPTAADLELACTEADRPALAGVSYLDSQLGLAVRRWCPPALGLHAHATGADYLARRTELGTAVATSRLLAAAQLDTLLVDTGLDGPGFGTPDDLRGHAGAEVYPVPRLERLAEGVAASGVGAGEFADRFRDALAAATEDAVAVKSIIAYRGGLDIEPNRPTSTQVRVAAGEWLTGGGGRLTNRTLLRFLLWSGVDTGLPVQLHTGFGDRDLMLQRADPGLLQPFLAAAEPAGVPIVLLHCYPYQRQAGWLAQVFPHVFVDVGLTVGQVGVRASAVLAEFLELAPLGKVMFSTDAYPLPELYLVGAAQFRLSLGRLLDGWVADDAMRAEDATRIARLIGADTARRVYRLPTSAREC